MAGDLTAAHYDKVSQKNGREGVYICILASASTVDRAWEQAAHKRLSGKPERPVFIIPDPRQMGWRYSNDTLHHRCLLAFGGGGDFVQL